MKVLSNSSPSFRFAAICIFLLPLISAREAEESAPKALAGAQVKTESSTATQVGSSPNAVTGAQIKLARKAVGGAQVETATKSVSSAEVRLALEAVDVSFDSLYEDAVTFSFDVDIDDAAEDDFDDDDDEDDSPQAKKLTTDFTVILIGGGVRNFVDAVTETRVFRERVPVTPSSGGARNVSVAAKNATDGAYDARLRRRQSSRLRQNYEVRFSQFSSSPRDGEAEVLRHSWKVVDDNEERHLVWNFSTDAIIQRNDVSRRWLRNSRSFPRSTLDLLAACGAEPVSSSTPSTFGTSPSSSSSSSISRCCICHPSDGHVPCIDGRLQVTPDWTSLAPNVSADCWRRDFRRASCPFVCECGRRCSPKKTDCLLSWTVAAVVASAVVVYVVGNACVVASSSSAAEEGAAAAAAEATEAGPEAADAGEGGSGMTREGEKEKGARVNLEEKVGE